MKLNGCDEDEDDGVELDEVSKFSIEKLDFLVLFEGLALVDPSFVVAILDEAVDKQSI